MKAYFDTNIFVELEQGNVTLEEILQRVDPNISSISFSSAHVSEAEEIRGISEQERNDRIAKRFETISAVTQNSYLYENMENQVFFQIETPISVLKTISEVPVANSIMKGLTSIISEEQKQQFRDMLGIDPKQINNYSSDEVIEQLNAKLTNWGTNLSFMELIEQAVSFHPQGSTFGLSHRVASMFELLDIIGYWKDKATESSNYARFWDSNHSFFAAHCEYFVSDDKRTRNKAKVVYHQFGIGTRVVSSQGVK